MRARNRTSPTGMTVMVAIAAAGVLACTGITEPRSPTITVSPAPSASTFTPAPAVVQLTGSTVSVSSTLSTATPCYAIDASDAVTADTLTISLVARSTVQNGAACAQVVATFAFTVKSAGVPSTVSRLRVVQDGAVGGVPHVIADQAISLPR